MEKIMGFFQYEKPQIFESMKEAVKYTGFSEKRILYCINSGHRWRCWTFDYVLDANKEEK